MLCFTEQEFNFKEGDTVPNFYYTNGLNKVLSGVVDWVNDDIRFMLVGSLSSAGADSDALTLSDINTLDRLSGVGYPVGDLPLTTQTIIDDDVNNQVRVDADDAQFTAINAGTAHAFIIYKFVSGDADSIPLIHNDGKSVVTLAAPAAASDTTIYVNPLKGDIPNGQVLDFGPETATLTAPAFRGDTSLTVSALAQAIAIGQDAESDAGVFPVITNGTDVNFIVNALGFCAFQRQKVTG